jgi:hypothetical protein
VGVGGERLGTWITFLFALVLVHTGSRRSATGRIGYKDRGTDAMIFPMQRYNKFL